MSQTIFLRIGQKNRVPLPIFINALKDFLGMLRDLDATISKDSRGSVIWEVVSLRQIVEKQLAIYSLVCPAFGPRRASGRTPCGGIMHITYPPDRMAGSRTSTCCSLRLCGW